MASTTIADYQVLRDSRFTLDTGGDFSREFTFDVPDDIHGATGGARKAIISFNFRPLETSRLRILFRASEVLDTTFDISHTRMHQEVFDIGSLLFQDFGSGIFRPDTVPVEFRVSPGKCRISDVVIWYQIER